MRKFWYALACLAVLKGAPVAFAQEKLILGNEGTYPPFSMVQPSGELVGVEPDLAREMCKRMQVTCEIVVMDFKALIPALLQGKLNLIASQMKPIPERKARALFSTPVVYNPDSYIVPKGKSYDFTKDGLKGVKMGLQRGSAQVKYITETFGASVEVVYYDNPDQIRLDLLSGRIEMTFGAKLNWVSQLIDKPEGKDWALAGGDLWAGDPSIPEDERGSSWLARKEDEALLAKVNATLKSMISDCTFTKIRAKYLSVPILPGDVACVRKGGR